jgi:hypothetical protein
MLDVLASMKLCESQKQQQNANLSTHCHGGGTHHVDGVLPGCGSSQNGIAQSLPAPFFYILFRTVLVSKSMPPEAVLLGDLGRFGLVTPAAAFLPASQSSTCKQAMTSKCKPVSMTFLVLVHLPGHGHWKKAAC